MEVVESFFLLELYVLIHLLALECMLERYRLHLSSIQNFVKNPFGAVGSYGLYTLVLSFTSVFLALNMIKV